jgi:4-alpha-glucanotransferase
MNRPAYTEGNWQWQLEPEQMSPGLSAEIRQLTELYGRA